MWVGVFIGVSVKDAETAQVAGFVWVFPLVFASSLYVPIETMPSLLQVLDRVNPVTPMADTVRALALGTSVTPAIWKILAWDAGIILAFLPLALRRYRALARQVGHVTRSIAIASSTRGIGLATALVLVKKVGLRLPSHIIVFGIEIADSESFAEQCTPEVAAAIDRCARLVLKHATGLAD